MRHAVAAFAFSLMLGAAPAALAGSAASAPAATSPAAKPAGAPFKEPNLRLPKNSGGVSLSPQIKDAPLSDDFVMGKADAPLLMIEYASMSCPHCAQFSAGVMPQVEKVYIETGKLRYILRQFPLNEPALKAAELLDCIGEQNTEKYYIFAKVLFDAQTKWAFDTNFMSGLETIATVGGLSKDQFQNCVVPTEREMKVLKKKKLAEESVKIPHTPFIFVGGEAFEGERTFENVSRFIDKKLAELEKPAEAKQ
jgi:protein-disulfide isomerase